MGSLGVGHQIHVCGSSKVSILDKIPQYFAQGFPIFRASRESINDKASSLEGTGDDEDAEHM